MLYDSPEFRQWFLQGLCINPRMWLLPPVQKINAPFKTTWNLPSGKFWLPTRIGGFNCTIDWGDGTTPTKHNSVIDLYYPSHTYADAGKYQISITGQYSGFDMYGNGGMDETPTKLISVDQWGNVGFKSFSNAFYSCINLISLPEGAITGAENVTDFRFCFSYCTSLKNIPTGLFDNNINVTDFTTCFHSCTSLQSIPNELFINNVNVIYFSDCFCNCTSLISIPTGLFDNNVKVTKFDGCFWNCTSLKNIPTGLFDNNINITDFSRCFAWCTSLQTIPNELFINNVNVTMFNACFYNCNKLILPTVIFNLSALQTKRTTMIQCFWVDSPSQSPTGIVQDIWNYATTHPRTACFWNCTSLTNYEDIPIGWKLSWI